MSRSLVPLDSRHQFEDPAEWSRMPSALHYRYLEGQRQGDVLLGSDYHTGDPLYLSKQELAHHLLATGSVGSGKTSTLLIGLVHQLIRGSGGAAVPPVVVIDPKLDRALFHSARRQAREAGVPFYNVLLQPGCATDRVDLLAPFDDVADLTGAQASVLAKALHLSSGFGYGASFYGAVGENELRRVINRWERSTGFLGLCQATQAGGHRDGEHARASLQAFLDPPWSTDVLDPHPGERCVDVATLVREGGVLYFGYPYHAYANEGAFLAGMLLWGVYHVLNNIGAHYGTAPRVWAIVDEAAEVVGPSYPTLLSKSRGIGLSVVSAIQSIRQLLTPNLDATSLLDTVGTRLTFDVASKVEVEELQFFSGEMMETRRSFSHSLSRGGSQGEDRSTSSRWGETESGGGSQAQTSGNNWGEGQGVGASLTSSSGRSLQRLTPLPDRLVQRREVHPPRGLELPDMASGGMPTAHEIPQYRVVPSEEPGERYGVSESAGWAEQSSRSVSRGGSMARQSGSNWSRSVSEGGGESEGFRQDENWSESFTVTYTEHPVPRLAVDDALAVSAEPCAAFLFRKGGGDGRVQTVRLRRGLDRATYDLLSRAPLPRASAKRLAVAGVGPDHPSFEEHSALLEGLFGRLLVRGALGADPASLDPV